jgi:hypothetical protein
MARRERPAMATPSMAGMEKLAARHQRRFGRSRPWIGSEWGVSCVPRSCLAGVVPSHHPQQCEPLGNWAPLLSTFVHRPINAPSRSSDQKRHVLQFVGSDIALSLLTGCRILRRPRAKLISALVVRTSDWHTGVRAVSNYEATLPQGSMHLDRGTGHNAPQEANPSGRKVSTWAGLGTRTGPMRE